MEVAKGINDALDLFFDQFNTERLASIKTCVKNTRMYKRVFENEKTAYMAFNSRTHTLYINSEACKNLSDIIGGINHSHSVVKKYINNPELYANKTEETKEFLRCCVLSGRDTVPENLMEIVFHEMGHNFESTLKQHPMYNEIVKNRKSFDKYISGYAQYSINEYLAESFVSFMKGEEIIDPILKRAFEASRR